MTLELQIPLHWPFGFYHRRVGGGTTDRWRWSLFNIQLLNYLKCIRLNYRSPQAKPPISLQVILPFWNGAALYYIWHEYLITWWWDGILRSSSCAWKGCRKVLGLDGNRERVILKKKKTKRMMMFLQQFPVFKYFTYIMLVWELCKYYYFHVTDGGWSGANQPVCSFPFSVLSWGFLMKTFERRYYL